LIKIEGISDRKEAASFIGGKAVWNNPRGKTLSGTIVGVLGKNGVVKASFKKGLPGHAVGAELNIRRTSLP
jgi:large subunit ribosomal protein L35Ae